MVRERGTEHVELRAAHAAAAGERERGEELHVGLIESDQWVRRHADKRSNQPYADFLADMGKGIPMGRVGTAEEFANIACFLASDAASYVTGTAINVDGNLSPVV